MLTIKGEVGPSAYYAEIMLISFIIVMCSYLYSVCLVCLVLKSSYFKEHLPVVQWLLSNTIYAIRKTMQRNLNYKYVKFLIVSLEEA